MEYLALAITIIASLAAAAVAYVLGKRSGFQASDEEITRLSEEARALESQLVETLSDNDRLASKGQTESLINQTRGFLEALAQQRQQLETITKKLDTIRADVEHREQEQHELRALKDEDEAAIQTTLSSYTQSSEESVALEQKLAESLRSLDAMSGEVRMTADQQAVFQELSNALTQASSQLRDVIIDYQAANERLSGLRARFGDLEKEYTKLIEQQLAS
jgi:DNA repair exonuclease SbcCD ATPase subunit